MRSISTDTSTSALTASILRVVFSGINNGSRDQTFTLSQVAICTFVVPTGMPTCSKGA